MDHAATRLKHLREQCRPALSIRKLASLLGLASSSYAFYEDANKFKKRYLPVELVRSLVGPFVERGISAEDVLSLGGIDATSEATFATPPSTQLLIPITLPPEEALERGFLAVLMASRQMDEAALAHELAVRLPTLLAVLQGPLRIEAAAPAPAEAPPSDHRERQRA